MFKKWAATEAEVDNKINEVVEAIAKEKGVSMAQIALAWSLSKPFISAPIVGSTKIDNLQDLLGMRGLGRRADRADGRATDGVNLKLTDEEIKRIEEPYQP